MQKQGWDATLVSNDDNDDREKNRVIRVRQRAIGRELRRMFENVVREQVPDEFLSLLQKMDERGDDDNSEER
jgi:hypothetical protein